MNKVHFQLFTENGSHADKSPVPRLKWKLVKPDQNVINTTIDTYV